MAFHSYTRLIQKLFNAYWCGPPYRVTGTSPWPSVDHSVSRLPPPTIRPLQARFHCGSVSRGTPPRRRRQLVGSLCKRHAVTPERGSDRLWANGFRDSFTPLPGVLFTFPSRYLFTIGLTGVFSLAGWSRRIRAGFLVPRVTQDTTRPRRASRTGLSPSMVGLSRHVPLAPRVPHRGPTTPRGRKAHPAVWALPRSLATTGGITVVFFSCGY